MEKQSQIINEQLSAFDSLCLSNIIIKAACRTLYKQAHIKKLKKNFLEFYAMELQGYKTVVCPTLSNFIDQYSQINLNFYMYMFAESPNTPAKLFKELPNDSYSYLLFDANAVNMAVTYNLEGEIKEKCVKELNEIIEHLEQGDELFTLYELYENYEHKKLVAGSIAKEVVSKQRQNNFLKNVLHFKKPTKATNKKATRTPFKQKTTGVVQLSLPIYPLNNTYPTDDKFSRINPSYRTKKAADPFKLLKIMEHFNIEKAQITAGFINKANKIIKETQKRNKLSNFF